MSRRNLQLCKCLNQQAQDLPKVSQGVAVWFGLLVGSPLILLSFCRIPFYVGKSVKFLASRSATSFSTAVLPSVI